MFIKRPNQSRKSYGLVGNDGKVVYDSRIDAVNKDLHSGSSKDILEQRMRIIRDAFKPTKIACSFYNEQLAKACHTSKVKRKHDLVDVKSLENRLKRAVLALGEVSLKEATEGQILDAVSKERGSGRRYHIIGAINELLRFANRDLRLHNPSPRIGQVTFLSPEEFVKQINKDYTSKNDTPYKLYLTALFATGCRVGELPTAVFDEEGVYISQQLKEDGTIQPFTKNKQDRRAPILPIFDKEVKEFIKLGSEVIFNIRLHHHRKMLNILNARLHDLRHSYAIYLAKKNFSLPQIARYIGDTEAVAKKHYAQYCPSDEEISSARKLLK